MSQQQPKYKIYPSLLDKFQRLQEALEDFESCFNEDGEGGYKKSYEEVVAELEQSLLDSINRVPHEPIEAADKGTAFNEIVDCLVHHRNSTNPDVLLASAVDEKTGGKFIRASINGFTFNFDLDFCQEVAKYFAGSTSQYFCKAILPTRHGDVELYGFLDELRTNVVYDIKTTSSYSFGKFASHWQHHVYPYCLIESGMVTEIKEFEYTAFQLSGGSSRNPIINGTMYRERYDFDYETSKAKLQNVCEQFIEWLEAHRSQIYKYRIFNEPEPEPYYLFFDTETTGLPKNYNAPITDTDNWPRLVQLGWIVTDKDGKVCKIGNHIIKPEGFEIPEVASAVHGITTEVAQEKGEDLTKVMAEFVGDLRNSKHIVGHNISFDKNVIGCEWIRVLGSDYELSYINEELMNKATSDTMRESTDYSKIPTTGKTAYKWPRLQQLYVKLFGHEFEDAHDAMADITATKDCFFELQRLGVIK